MGKAGTKNVRALLWVSPFLVPINDLSSAAFFPAAARGQGVSLGCLAGIVLSTAAAGAACSLGEPGMLS